MSVDDRVHQDQQGRPDRSMLLYIVDPSLKNVAGHYFEYDRAVAEGAREAGYDPVVLGSRDVEPAIAEKLGARKVFTRDVWGLAGPGTRFQVALNMMRDNALFGWELLRAIRRDGLPERSVIFAHTVINRQMLALALLPFLLFRHRTVRFNFLLRYQPEFYMGPVSALSFRLLEWIARYRTIHLTTDSARLADQLGVLTDLPIHVLPIPHVPPAPPAERGRDPDRPTTFVSLGNARDEKGIFEILDAIRILHRNARLDGMRFVLQCNDAAPDVKAAIDAFHAENLPNCELLFDKLTTGEYYRRLHEADVGLVPYWRSIYLARTSGVFMESLSAGKVVIATTDTWMSDQLADHGAGLLCPDRSALALAKAMLHVKLNRDTLLRQAADRQAAWLAAHNPRALVAAMDALDSTGTAAQTPPRRALILYPHDDVVGSQGGASRRVNLMMDFLAARGIRVRVLESGDHPRLTLRGAEVEALGAEPRAKRRRDWTDFLLKLRSLGRGLQHRWIFWHYVRIQASPPQRRRILQSIRWADVVLLEYPFWADAVIPMAHREGRRVILTEYDVIAEQIKDMPALKAAAWRNEARAIRQADAAVTVSPLDQDHLRQRGLASVMSPIPTDARLFAVGRIPQARAILSDVYGVEVPWRQFCLFVGSRHEPNVLAAADLRRAAEALGRRPDGADIGIVVAGACAEPGRGDRFIALGRVDDGVLLALYAACAVVLVPIPYGTGVSVKSIEGMATGKPVLGTTVSFRGLDVTADVNAVVEDDMTRYPDRIVAIAGDPALSATLGAGAQAFAHAYLPDVAYQPYLDLLGLPRDDPAQAGDVARSIDPMLLRIGKDAMAAGQADLAHAIAGEVLRLDPDNAQARRMRCGAADIVTTDEAALAWLEEAAPEPVPDAEPGPAPVAAPITAPAVTPVAAPLTPAEKARARWLAVRDRIIEPHAAGHHHVVIERALALLDDHAEIAELHYLLACSMHAVGVDGHGAFRHYTRALHLGFPPYPLLMARGLLCQDLGRNGRAVRDLARALTLHPVRRQTWPIYDDTLRVTWRLGLEKLGMRQAG